MAVPKLHIENQPGISHIPSKRRRASRVIQPRFTQEDRQRVLLTALEEDMRTYLHGGELSYAQAEQVIAKPLRRSAWNMMQRLGGIFPMDEVPSENRNETDYLILMGNTDEIGNTRALVGQVSLLETQDHGICSVHYREIGG